ncbi:MAG: CBS domain-containing protein, partial [Nitrospinaceae bacterium]|nr:magnesium transporter [Nitrospinaceae bacterium]NIR55463.1 magnesium transporter [Nitrospinaceae bacterium]NIS85903.1 magnesium transporter [Nitrospinaceae bacterium]NIT82747.1 magnesium transporter [Nitrospinaceae bacterium]NIU44956.1 magnesium transporter [Nitrospinaceae bacterium]
MPTEKIQAYFENPELSAEEIKSLINSMDHFEIARRLHELPVETKIRIFHFLDSDQKRMELLYETDKHSRLEIQDSLDVDDLARLLQGIPEDEATATDIIMEHPDETRDEILEKMSPQEGETIKNLITYGEQTAGGLMVRHYNKVRENEAAAEILLKLKRDRNQDSPPYFYVVNEKNQLLGYFNLRQLLNVPANARPLEFISQDTPKVLYSDSCEKVANLMDHEHLSVIPVVNEDNVMQGIVTFDDVIRAMQDIASEDIFTMVGTDTVDPFARKTVQKIT